MRPLDGQTFAGDVFALMVLPDPPVDPMTGAKLLDTTFPPIEYAIDRWFPRSEITEIAGTHAIGKSTIALGACCSVATGRPWGDVPVTKGVATFITMEDRHVLLQQRVRAWIASIADPDARAQAERDIRQNLKILGREFARGYRLTACRFAEGRDPGRVSFAEAFPPRR